MVGVIVISVDPEKLEPNKHKNNKQNNSLDIQFDSHPLSSLGFTKQDQDKLYADCSTSFIWFTASRNCVGAI